jgi:hypothetical protein
VSNLDDVKLGENKNLTGRDRQTEKKEPPTKVAKTSEQEDLHCMRCHAKFTEKGNRNTSCVVES